MKTALCVAAMMAVFGGGSAVAADIITAPAYNWTGFYLGGQAQLDFMHFNEVTPFNLNSSTNIGGGLSAQYLYQSKSLVFGVVADGNLLTGDTTAGCLVGGPNLQCQVGSRWNGSLRAKGGFAADRFLVYGTAGWGWAETHVNITSITPAGSQSDSHVLNGWVAGAGISFALTDKWTTSLEYLHYDLNSAQETQFVAYGTGHTHPTSDTVTVGLSYKF